MANLKKKKIEKLIDNFIFPLTGQHVEEAIKRRAQFKSLGIEVETLAKNCGFPSESVYDGSFWNNVLESDLFRELDKLRPEIPLGRPVGSRAYQTLDELTQAVRKAIEKLDYNKDKINKINISYELGINEKTFYDYCIALAGKSCKEFIKEVDGT